MTGDLVTSGHHMGKQGQPRPPRDNGPDTDMCADSLWLARPGSANDRRLTQSVADPVPVANLTLSNMVIAGFVDGRNSVGEGKMFITDEAKVAS